MGRLLSLSLGEQAAFLYCGQINASQMSLQPVTVSRT